jgi:hypothetical protein
MSEFPLVPHALTNAHQGLAAAMYKSFCEGARDILHIADGRTDLQADLGRRGIKASVQAIDPTQGNPQTRNGGLAELLDFPDDTFDLIICQYAMLRESESARGEAVREMVRLVRPQPTGERPRHWVLINPIYQPEKLYDGLAEAGLGDVAAVIDHDRSAISMSRRREVHPTLRVQKTEHMTPDVEEKLIGALVVTRALHRRRKLRDLIRRRP